jgi:hypothetical protein
MNTPHHDALLSRTDLAAALQAAGFKVSRSTLSTLATRGGSPPYQKFGKYPLYRWGDALAWAKGKLRTPVRSTSEQPPHAA